MWDLRYDEPRLDEMLRDPVMLAVMDRDRVTREDLMVCVEHARRRLLAQRAAARCRERARLRAID
ncbi:MAG: hypothetical protein IBJ15_18070 [Alphaproteobacteria bacterium]|nr:hypothetical protein [Alphaproteobacteria bacterium]